MNIVISVATKRCSKKKKIEKNKILNILDPKEGRKSENKREKIPNNKHKKQMMKYCTEMQTYQ